MTAQIQIDAEWKSALLPQFQAPYMGKLRSFLKKQAEKKRTVYPKGTEIFNAFNFTPLSEVKVVVLGQDPYHGPNQAHGLCFSVKKGVPAPPSLKNIFQELQTDIGISIPDHGDLSAWARQGVLLLNTVLTVEHGKAASHRGQGWEEFTDNIIQLLNDQSDPIVFVLWGSFAQTKASMISTSHHHILKAPHPSPLSAYRGFFGSKPFSQINHQLEKWGRGKIDWSLD